MPEAKSKRPNDSKFKQQKLKAWQPILTPNSVICTFTLIGAIFIPIGVGVLLASNSIIDAGPFRYDKDQNNVTFVKFTWPKTTKNKVYFYYQLTNFYQNHRRYVRSRSDIQLASSRPADKQVVGDCEPWKTWQDFQPPNVPPPPGDLSNFRLNPCGLIANSQFNDTFNIFTGECRDEDTCNSTNDITSRWTNKGIAWKSDLEKKFKNIEGFTVPNVVQHKNVEDEEFIVWMRTAGLPTFKKLHRILNSGLEQGTYTIRIGQHFPVAEYDGEKAFYLSTTTWIGGRNDFLGWAYIVVGIVCMILALVFLVKKLTNPRAGDPRAMGKH
eukprot:c20946_g1_i1.p1 GENE.c20946_g1_i1~~c20946_g1_i1.p1  ORF type:complete len:326 (-),score=69.69 c20946_g1_i1:123-1100(-)